MKERQTREINKIANIIGIFTIGFALLLSIAEGTATGINAAFMFHYIVDIVALLVIIYLALKKMDHPKYKHFIGITLTVVFIVQLMITNLVYMYAFMYPLCLFVMLYMDVTYSKLATSMCGIVNIIFCIKNYIKFPDRKNELIIQLCFAVATCIISYLVVMIQQKHSNENTDEIMKNMEDAESKSKAIMDLSNQLAAKFDEARNKADSATDSMFTSNNAVGEIAESVKVTAEAIEQQTMLTSDIQKNVEAANSQTEVMIAASKESIAAIASGMDLMEELNHQALLTGELNKKSSDSTDELNSRIQNVNSIIDEILSISTQTNLLALNASIEAARAGEAGKGFAVVADEIRKLSEQTKDSANKITEIIAQLISNAEDTSQNMKKSIDASELQNTMISNTIDQMKLVEEKNDDLNKSMNIVSSEVESILKATISINDSISNLSAMSEEVAASSESSSEVMNDSMHAMEELNGLLNEIYAISNAMREIS